MNELRGKPLALVWLRLRVDSELTRSLVGEYNCCQGQCASFNHRRIKMGDRKRGQEQIRNLTQNRTGTYSISLPIELIRQLSWRSGQKLVVKRSGKKLIIEDWQS